MVLVSPQKQIMRAPAWRDQTSSSRKRNNHPRNEQPEGSTAEGWGGSILWGKSQLEAENGSKDAMWCSTRAPRTIEHRLKVVFLTAREFTKRTSQ